MCAFPVIRCYFLLACVESSLYTSYFFSSVIFQPNLRILACLLTRKHVLQLHVVKDEGLKSLLMSWYYAGYYTGLYEGQQQRDPGKVNPDRR